MREQNLHKKNTLANKDLSSTSERFSLSVLKRFEAEHADVQRQNADLMMIQSFRVSSRSHRGSAGFCVRVREHT